MARYKPGDLPANLLTIYGRKPVLEALRKPDIAFFRVHLATSNQPSAILREIEDFARERGIEILHHDRDRLARISKNKKQDQGVAADIVCPHFADFSHFIAGNAGRDFSLMALENITNPQNLGMIIRSVCASAMHGILLPRHGCAKLDALVIKASAGTLFNSRIFFCDTLRDALTDCRQAGVHIYGLSSHNSADINFLSELRPNIFLLGNETTGLSPELRELCHQIVHIPMHNGIESLNVAVAAGIVAFRPGLVRSERRGTQTPKGS